jgi:catechol 2,3-dioxygenase-like lactoylglutathione lyase family enzyme
MAITAAHMLFYTPQADELRAVLRDVFEWDHVEDTPGWLIFKLPPSELGVHPSDGSTKHEVCLMCDDIEATMSELRAKGIEFRGGPTEESFGITTTMLLPGGVEILLYQPTHSSPLT